MRKAFTRSGRVARRELGLGLCEWVGHDLFERHAFVHETVDERGVGAVLEQPSYEIGEQIGMRADRCIGAHGRKILDAASRFVVEQAAHAVQALELERYALAAQCEYRADAVGVVGGELRVHDRTRSDQALGATEPRGVGGGLARVDRVLLEAAFLRALDLAVPVRALDETHGERSPQRLRQSHQMIDDRRGASTVGLDGDPQTGGIAGRRVTHQGLDEFERDLEAVLFFGIEGQCKAARRGEPREFEGSR